MAAQLIVLPLGNQVYALAVKITAHAGIAATLQNRFEKAVVVSTEVVGGFNIGAANQVPVIIDAGLVRKPQLAFGKTGFILAAGKNVFGWQANGAAARPGINVVIIAKAYIQPYLQPGSVGYCWRLAAFQQVQVFAYHLGHLGHLGWRCMALDSAQFLFCTLLFIEQHMRLRHAQTAITAGRGNCYAALKSHGGMHFMPAAQCRLTKQQTIAVLAGQFVLQR